MGAVKETNKSDPDHPHIASIDDATVRANCQFNILTVQIREPKN